MKAGRDLHIESAKGCLGLDRDPTDDERQIGKHTNYSIIFGGGVGAVIRQVQKIQPCTPDQAKEILKRWHNTWPGVGIVQDQLRVTLISRGFGIPAREARARLKQAKWKQRSRLIEEAVARGGYISTLWGRQLHPESDHKALNVLIQGNAADLIRQALLKIHDFTTREQLVSHLVNVVHDEAQIDAVDDEIPLLVETVPTLMDEPRISKVIPIKTDVEITYTNWAEKTAYDERSIAA